MEAKKAWNLTDEEAAEVRKRSRLEFTRMQEDLLTGLASRISPEDDSTDALVEVEASDDAGQPTPSEK